MPRPHRLPRPGLLLALVAGLVAGACGGSLYDADGVPQLNPGNCDPGTHLCGTGCKADRDPDFCAGADRCDPCGPAALGGQRACLPNGPGGAYLCESVCPAGTRVCDSACTPHTVASCTGSGASCQPCPGSPANGTAVCADQGGGAFACDYTCGPGFFKLNGGCAPPTAVAAGQQHTCAIVQGGALLCWGANAAGQLGPGTAAVTSLQAVLVFADSVVAVAAGGRHTCAVIGGAVACWGANDLGQLGRGTTGAASATPAAVSGANGALAGVTALAAGADHTCALVGATGAVRCWGANGQGQAGTGATSVAVAAPAASAAIASGATALSARADNTCALTGAGLACWGANASGQTGKGSATTAEPTAVAVAGLPAAPFAFAVGDQHACALVGGQGFWCWGDNGSWQLGSGALTGPGPFPAPVRGTRIDQGRGDQHVAAGAAFTCVTRAGQNPPSVNCGGRNAEQQTGAPLLAPPDPAQPTLADKNEVPIGVEVVGVVAGSAHGCALVNLVARPGEQLQLRCWGRNAEGQLGRPTTGNAPDGTALPVPP